MTRYAENTGGNEMAQNKGHPAAAILREIAEVAEWHPEPWREFEYLSLSEWRQPVSLRDFMVSCLDCGCAIRRKPRTKRIGNYDVPLPEREAPALGTKYWVTDPTEDDFQIETEWYGHKTDLEWLSRDLIHLDSESAEIHGRALASLMQDGVE